MAWAADRGRGRLCGLRRLRRRAAGPYNGPRVGFVGQIPHNEVAGRRFSSTGFYATCSAGAVRAGARGTGRMKEVYLADVHAAPTDPAVKLAYADWLYNQWGLPRGELIAAQEAARQAPGDQVASDRRCEIAAKILACGSSPLELLGRLWELLEERALRMFEADCAERVLAIFEAACPGDTRPRRAVEACRKYVRGRIRLAELDAAGHAAQETSNSQGEPSCSAGSAAGGAAFFGSPYNRTALESATLAVEIAGGDGAGDAETCWQVGRLIDLWLYGWDYPLLPAERNALPGKAEQGAPADRPRD